MAITRASTFFYLNLDLPAPLMNALEHRDIVQYILKFVAANTKNGIGRARLVSKLFARCGAAEVKGAVVRAPKWLPRVLKIFGYVTKLTFASTVGASELQRYCRQPYNSVRHIKVKASRRMPDLLRLIAAVKECFPHIQRLETYKDACTDMAITTRTETYEWASPTSITPSVSHSMRYRMRTKITLSKITEMSGHECFMDERCSACDRTFLQHKVSAGDGYSLQCTDANERAVLALEPLIGCQIVRMNTFNEWWRRRLMELNVFKHI